MDANQDPQAKPERAYSDEMAQAVRWNIERLTDRFVASPAHAELTKAQQREVRIVLQLVADVAYGYELETVEEWSMTGLAQALSYAIPHKVMAGKSFFAAVKPIVLSFLRWGMSERVWCDRDLTEVIEYVQSVGGKLGAANRRRKPALSAPDQILQASALPDPPPLRIKRSRISKANGKVYRLCISLLGIEPEIWRRVEVADLTLAKLHGVIQYAMGWKNSHLHMFLTPLGRFTDPQFHLVEDEWCADVGDSRRIRLGDLLASTRDAFEYEYDFGDSWRHRIACEALGDPEPGTRYPGHSRCLAGARACPPEDVGGVTSYQDFLRVIADPTDEEHERMVEWSMHPRRGRFDPEYFDPGFANDMLRV
ncbi:MAG: plasmid pRiA4b ORF-3 family protein [Planctomycetes bacterium]|nr:plasmid pRiA4b ORF-3 family protein [Planctomycetota bacterium]